MPFSELYKVLSLFIHAANGYWYTRLFSVYENVYGSYFDNRTNLTHAPPDSQTVMGYGGLYPSGTLCSGSYEATNVFSDGEQNALINMYGPPGYDSSNDGGANETNTSTILTVIFWVSAIVTLALIVSELLYRQEKKRLTLIRQYSWKTKKLRAS